MSIDILIVDTPSDTINKLSKLFGDRSYWYSTNNGILLIKQSPGVNVTSTYSSLSEDVLATLEFLPDFDTRYIYLLSLSLGIDA